MVLAQNSELVRNSVCVRDDVPWTTTMTEGPGRKWIDGAIFELCGGDGGGFLVGYYCVFVYAGI